MADSEREGVKPAIVSLYDMPNWRQEPSTLLWNLGERITGIKVTRLSRKVVLPEEVEKLRQRIEEKPNFYPGPFANVEAVSFYRGEVEMTVSETDFFSYLAASYYYRNNQGDNPGRPLSVLAVPITSDNKLIFEKRIDVADFPDKLGVFGGVLTPDSANNPQSAVIHNLQRKLGLELESRVVEPIGVGRDNINYVFCLFYLVRFAPGQAEEMLTRLRRPPLKKVLYAVSADEALAYIERLLEHRDKTYWNPLAHDNLLYALVSANLRTPRQVTDLLESTKGSQVQYSYPMERFL